MVANVVLLSGGIDSTTLVATLVDDDSSVRAVFIDYGQAAADDESASARLVARHYEIPLEVITVRGMAFGEGEIRGRNGFLLNTALLAARPGATVLHIGIHGGTPYVDCSPSFIEVERRSFDLQTGGTVQIAAPFLAMSKGDVFALARDMGVLIDLTYSCERGGQPCGTCLSCLDRSQLSAFA